MKRVIRLQPTVHPVGRTGYTLVEMMISLAAGAILLAGLGATIVVSAQAWSENLSPRQQADTSEATRRIHDDLQFALQFSERTSQAATFTVPDRDGDGVKETIRYEWTGTAGDPLTVSLNGQAAESLISNVQNFQFDWQSRTMVAPVLEIDPSLLFLCAGTGDPGEVTLTAQEQLKVSHLQQISVVLTASVSMSQATLEPLIDSSHVVYISGDVDPAEFPSWIAETPVGIICERVELCDELGVSDSHTSIDWSELRPVNMTHDVLDGAAQNIDIADSSQSVSVLVSPFSPDLRVLALAGFDDLEVILAVAEAGAEGVTAPFIIPGRRVMLPTGGPGCDFAESDPDYLTIIDNAVVWASGEGDDAPLDLQVMLVANNTPWPDDRARDRLFLLQSLGCRVDVVAPDLTSAQYDAALVGVDAVWICDTVDPASSASILSEKSVGVVIEYKDWLATFGFGSGTATSSGDSSTIANLSHPILNGFSTGDLQVTWSSQSRSDSSGYPTGMQVLASPTGGSPGAASLGSIETGATTHIGDAAGRRVWFNMNQCYSNDMVVEFQSLLINAMNWAGD